MAKSELTRVLTHKLHEEIRPVTRSWLRSRWHISLLQCIHCLQNHTLQWASCQQKAPRGKPWVLAGLVPAACLPKSLRRHQQQGEALGRQGLWGHLNQFSSLHDLHPLADPDCSEQRSRKPWYHPAQPFTTYTYRGTTGPCKLSTPLHLMATGQEQHVTAHHSASPTASSSLPCAPPSQGPTLQLHGRCMREEDVRVPLLFSVAEAGGLEAKIKQKNSFSISS